MAAWQPTASKVNPTIRTKRPSSTGAVCVKWAPSRTTFAGGILSTYNDDGTFNRDDVSRWLREPEVVKDNAANDLPDGTLPRGMPNLGLSERTISDLVAYLETLGPRPTDEIIADSEVE